MVIGHNEWLALIIGVILMMTGSQLFRGKWLFLIAGYNTLSQSDKEKLNSKFIGRVNRYFTVAFFSYNRCNGTLS